MLLDVTPIYENTTMKASVINDVTMAYRIYPNEGYVLHSTGYDTPIFDEETMEETGEVAFGYTRGYVSVNRNYDFEANPFVINAVLETEVPADQI